MSGLVDALVVLAVIALVIARQLRPSQVGGGRWWLLPGVLIVLAIRDGGLIDPHHREAATAILAAELAVGVGMGLVWARTTRIWTDRDGEVWTQGTRATLAVWLAGAALRGGLYAVAAVVGVHQSSGSLLLAVAVTLLIRTGMLLGRTRSVESSYRTAS